MRANKRTRRERRRSRIGQCAFFRLFPFVVPLSATFFAAGGCSNMARRGCSSVVLRESSWCGTWSSSESSVSIVTHDSSSSNLSEYTRMTDASGADRPR
jgi:hypothetical protein